MKKHPKSKALPLRPKQAQRRAGGVAVNCVWNVMAHAQKPDFVFRRNGPVHLNRPGGGGHQFSRLPSAEVCASAVVMLDTPCSEVVWRVLATHCIRQVLLHFPSRASPCAITFQVDSSNLSCSKYSFLPICQNIKYIKRDVNIQYSSRRPPTNKLPVFVHLLVRLTGTPDYDKSPSTGPNVDN